MRAAAGRGLVGARPIGRLALLLGGLEPADAGRRAVDAQDALRLCRAGVALDFPAGARDRDADARVGAGDDVNIDAILDAQRRGVYMRPRAVEPRIFDEAPRAE